MSRTFIPLFFSIAILSYAPVFAVEIAPRISDKEIIAGLSDIRGDIKGMKAEINGVRSEINGIRSEIKNLEEKQNIKIDGLRAELKAEMNGLRSEMNARFDDIRWMFSIFITLSLIHI